MKIINIQELANELNIDETAVQNEIVEVVKQLQSKSADICYLLNAIEQQSARLFIVNKDDITSIKSGFDKTCFMDLAQKFSLSANDLNWILFELLNKKIIKKEIFDYYTEVKSKPSVTAMFEPEKISVSEKTTLVIEINCLCEILDPTITIEGLSGLELEEDSTLPTKIYKGKTIMKYQYQASIQGKPKASIRFGGIVEGVKLCSEVNAVAVIEILPMPPELIIAGDQLSYQTNYQEPFRIVLNISNRGAGAAQNVDLRGLEKYVNFDVLEPTLIGNIASHGSVKYKIMLKPKKSGIYSFNDLYLSYEDLAGKALTSAVPKQEINVTTPKPKLNVELIIPDVVEQNRIFNLTLRISNVGEGDAKNVSFILPVDPKTVQSGTIDCNIPRIRSNEKEEIRIRLQAPDNNDFVVPDFEVRMQDIEDQIIVDKIFGTRVLVRANNDGGNGEKGKLKPSWPFGLNQVIGGQYQIIEEIGEGGFSKVYIVKRTRVTRGEEFALKALKPEFVSNPTIVANFIDEAKLTRDMKEDHIMSVQYVDVERSQDLEYPYIIMEYIKGGTLREKLDSGEQIDLVKCTEIMNDMCLALSYAHQNNFAHFDIKPSNIFYDNEKKRWKLGDFGLAKAVNIGGSMTPRGSLPYMAPEMREGKGSSKSDVYSLGKVFMEILTGDLNGELGQLEKIHGTEYHDELEQYTSLIDEMLNANPAKRPSIRDVMKIFSVSKTRTNQPKRKGR